MCITGKDIHTDCSRAGSWLSLMQPGAWVSSAKGMEPILRCKAVNSGSLGLDVDIFAS